MQNGLMAAASEHMALGAMGERAVAEYLAELGWRLLDRNWRPAGAAAGLELDIVARDGQTLVFVEVKTRKKSSPDPCRLSGGAGEKASVPVYAAFTQKKQRRLVRAAQHYLAAHELWALPCRFDLVCVEQETGGKLVLEHHGDVIEFGNFVGSRYASWQPW